MRTRDFTYSFEEYGLGHVWYSNIDRLVMPANPTSPKAVFIKTCLDQLTWAPFFNCVFIAFIDILKVKLFLNILLMCL